MLINPTHRCCGAFQKWVLLRCYAALSAAGFVRFRQGGVDWPLRDGFHCWVGLDSVLNKDHLVVNPHVGLHVVPIMRLCAALEHRKYDRCAATYALDLGELKSREPIFRFTPHSNLDAVVGRLVRLYTSVGLMYAESIARYELLLPLLQSRVGMRAQYPERTAACLHLMGREAEARTFTENLLTQNRDYFNGFAVPFKNLLDRESSAAASPPAIRARSARASAPQQRGRDPVARMGDDFDLRNNSCRHFDEAYEWPTRSSLAV
jgi:hypothetical protein